MILDDRVDESDDAPRPSWASPQQLQGLEDGEFVDRRKSRMECVCVEISIEGTKNITKKGSTFTVYVIHVSPGIKSWFVERRFSDFIFLNQQLHKYFPSINFPPLPKKTIFSSGNSTRIVEERKQMLQAYLQSIARIQSVWNRTELVRFLDNDSNSMMFVWNFERMQKMQLVLSTMTIDNTSKTAKLTAELRTAQEQVAILQERIARMEMLFLQNAAGVSPFKLSAGVLESISSAPIDIVPLPAGATKKLIPKTKWSDSFRPTSKSADFIDEDGNSNDPNNSKSLGVSSNQSRSDIMDMLESVLHKNSDSFSMRPDSEGGDHDHSPEVAVNCSSSSSSVTAAVVTSNPIDTNAAVVVKKTPLTTVEEKDDEHDLDLLDIETISDVISEHVESGQPLPEDQIIQALNMAYGRQAIQIPNIVGQGGAATTLSADGKSPSASRELFDLRSMSWSKRGLSKEEKKELKTFAISAQLNHALRISDDVLGAADAHLNALSKIQEEQESIEDTLRDIRSVDDLSLPIGTLNKLNEIQRNLSCSPESPSSHSGSQQIQLHPALEVIAFGCGTPSASSTSLTSSQGTHWIGELFHRSDLILQALLPTIESLDMRHRVFHYLRGVMSATLGAQLFPVGSFVSGTFLPGGDIDVTSFLVQHEDENWFVRVNEALCMSSFGAAAAPSRDAAGASNFRRVSVRNVSFVNAEVKIVRSEINGISVDISANQLASVYAQAFIMKIDEFIGCDHLFKKSILLVKAWCKFESPRFSNGTGCILGAKEGRLSSWAIVVMLIWIFNMNGREIFHPLQALGRFLSYYSCFDWNKYALTVSGVVDAADLSPINLDKIEGDASAKNIVRLGNYFPEELLNHYRLRYANSKAASRETFDSLYGSGAKIEDNSSSYAGVSLPAQIDDKRGNWGAVAAFSSSDFYRRGLVNIMSPILPTVSLTRAVDVIGLMTIRRVLSDGFSSFEGMCEGCKGSSTTLSTRTSESTISTAVGSDSVGSGSKCGQQESRTLSSDMHQESNIPTIVKEFWQNTAVLKLTTLVHSPRTTAVHEMPETIASAAGTVDTLASQLDELEVCLQHAELVLASVVSQPALIRLVIQILAQRGPMPVGEIGKHLHLITGSDIVSKRLKELFGGLKKAVESASCPQIQIMNDHQFNPTIRLVATLPVSPALTSTYITCFDHSYYRLPLKPLSLGNVGKGNQYGRKLKDAGKGSSVSGSVNGDNYRRGYDNFNNSRYMSDTASQASVQSHRSMNKSRPTGGAGSARGNQYASHNNMYTVDAYNNMIAVSSEQQFAEQMYVATSADAVHAGGTTVLMGVNNTSMAYNYPSGYGSPPVVTSPMSQVTVPVQGVSMLPVSVSNVQYQYVPSNQMPVYYYQQSPQQQQPQAAPQHLQQQQYYHGDMTNPNHEC